MCGRNTPTAWGSAALFSATAAGVRLAGWEAGCFCSGCWGVITAAGMVAGFEDCSWSIGDTDYQGGFFWQDGGIELIKIPLNWFCWVPGFDKDMAKKRKTDFWSSRSCWGGKIQRDTVKRTQAITKKWGGRLNQLRLRKSAPAKLHRPQASLSLSSGGSAPLPKPRVRDEIPNHLPAGLEGHWSRIRRHTCIRIIKIPHCIKIKQKYWKKAA